MAVPEETEKKARDVNEKTALLKKKSATELGELATSITTIARDAHMEANLEMEIVPQGLRVLIKDDQNRNMFERGSAQIMPRTLHKAASATAGEPGVRYLPLWQRPVQPVLAPAAPENPHPQLAPTHTVFLVC